MARHDFTTFTLTRSETASLLSDVTGIDDAALYADLTPDSGITFEVDGTLYTPMADDLVVGSDI